MNRPIITLLDPFSSDIRSDDPKIIRKYGGNFVAVEGGRVVEYDEKFTEILEKIDNPNYNDRNIFLFYLSVSGEKPKPA